MLKKLIKKYGKYLFYGLVLSLPITGFYAHDGTIMVLGTAMVLIMISAKTIEWLNE